MDDETPGVPRNPLDYASLRGRVHRNRHRPVSWAVAHVLTVVGGLLAVLAWRLGHPTPHPFRSEDYEQLVPFIIGLPLCAIQSLLMTASIICVFLPRSPAKPWGWLAALTIADIAFAAAPILFIGRLLHR